MLHMDTFSIKEWVTGHIPSLHHGITGPLHGGCIGLEKWIVCIK